MYAAIFGSLCCQAHQVLQNLGPRLPAHQTIPTQQPYSQLKLRNYGHTSHTHRMHKSVEGVSGSCITGDRPDPAVWMRTEIQLPSHCRTIETRRRFSICVL